MFQKVSILIVFICISAFSLQAQTGSVRGFVYEKESGEPVIFTSIYLQGTTHGMVSDVNGFFNMTKIPVGSYTLIISYIGYDTLKVPIQILKNRIVTKELYVEESAYTLDVVQISAERKEVLTQVRTSVIKVSPKQIQQIPSIGGEPDLAQYLQVLPGVIFTGDQGGQLYIRGGSPIQNKLLLDGMIVYNPFHSIGLFSVFDSELIRNADIHTGGFGAKYGGRISSIMDITMKDGNKKKFGGSFSSSTFGSKLLLEGPIIKKTDINNGSMSYIFSGKTSYLEQSSKLLYTYINEEGLPFNFTDLYGKVTTVGANGTKINLFGFNFKDNVSYEAISDLDWEQKGIGGNIILVPSYMPILLKVHAAYSSYDIKMQGLEASNKRSSMIGGFNGGLEFLYFLGDNELHYGLEVITSKTDFTYNNSLRDISHADNTTEFGVYIKYKYCINKKLVLDPSFRLHYYSSLSNLSPEPRLGLKYNITERLRFKFAGGFYSQNLIAATSDRDVVNLFYGFLSGSDNLPETFNGEDITHFLQKSRHAILGFEFDLTSKMNLNVEGYIKDNTQLTNINRNKFYDDNSINTSQPDILKKDFIIETGDAYGIDFLLKYDYKRLYLWGVYSLGFVNRLTEEYNVITNEVNLTSYHPHYDRRHNINLVGSYKLGRDKSWKISTRWNFGSGFPFTQTRGYFEKINFENGINTNYVISNGDIGYISDVLNGGRLPYYHRLDLTLKKMFKLQNKYEIETVFTITNVYNRKNIFYFDRFKYERVNQLPFMPSIGAKMIF